jgi:WD40 repeat protein
MASISEDCTVKLWSLKTVMQKYNDSKGNVEPYFTMRGHTGPLLAVTGSSTTNTLFTAGTEGQIRVWNVPDESEVNLYGNTYDGKNYCVAVWQDAEMDAIWDLKYHPFQELLLSISASSSKQVVLWSCDKLDTNLTEQDNPSQILTSFELDSSSDCETVPTACTWLNTQ